jgi:hypothetical protein
MTNFEKLVGRALLDPKYREQLQKSPRIALKKVGIPITDEKLIALRDCSDAFDRLRKLFGGEKAFY